ncbi:MAG: class I SAM-dependent methyltransferase [Pirellulales bacterium]
MNSPAAGLADHAPNPGLIFDTLNAFQRSFALRGAIELDLFSALARGADTAAALAPAVGADERALRILCDFLTVHGFLQKQSERYSLTPTAALFLDRDSPHYMGKMVGFIHSPHLLDAFRDVASLVRRGGTLLEGKGTVEDEFEGWVEFAKSMMPMMRPPAHFISEWASRQASGPIRVLDIAAGHGAFGIAIAQRNPEAQVVALDWGKVLEVAVENAAAAGVADRYSLLPGDALQLDYGQGFDFVLLTNFLHHFDRPTCVSVLRKAASALSERGQVVTLEFVPNEDRVSPPVPATFSFTMLGTTPAGDAYTFAEYEAMGREAGLASHELHDVPNSAQRVIVSRRG